MKSSAATARDIMTTPIVTLRDTARLARAADVLVTAGISGALVVDSKRKPVGVASLFDLARRITGAPLVEHKGDYSIAWEPEGDTGAADRVRDIMTTTVLTVPANLPVHDVAWMLWSQRVHRVFVVNRGIPVGVISAMDIVGAYVGARRPERKN